MDIGIIGAGNIGSALATQFAKAGHRVAIANSRGPESLAELVQSIPGDIRATDAPGAAPQRIAGGLQRGAAPDSGVGEWVWGAGDLPGVGSASGRA